MLKNLDSESASTKITTSRRLIVMKSFVVGLAAGLLAVCYRLALEYFEELRGLAIEYSKSSNQIYMFVLPVAFAMVITTVVYATARFCPDAGGSGIPHLKGYLSGHKRFDAWKVLWVKFIGGVLGIGSGLALGREGPTVQMGASVAKIFGDKVSETKVEKKILISAGAGAGLAAAFNAPMAGVFFVLEELHSSFHQVVLISAFVASVTADIVCRLMMGRLPVFHVKIEHYPELNLFPYFLLFGATIGLIGLVFNRALLGSSAYVERLGLRRKVVFAGVVGLIFGVVAFLKPETLGTGGGLITATLSGQVIIAQLLLFLALRFAFTLASYSTGAPGGIFAPMLLLGVLSGAIFGGIFSGFMQASPLDLAAWSVLGMAGLFSAVVRAPITGTILILEMTGAYDLLLPLMLVSIVAYGVPELFKDKPIYEALLHRDLERQR